MEDLPLPKGRKERLLGEKGKGKGGG